MKTDLRKPCDKCPFRRESIRGWLGPWEPAELLFALGREPFPCHLTIREDEQELSDATLHGCAGAAIFLNNKCERSRHPVTAEHQAKVLDVAPDVKASVFQWAHEFLAHHDDAPLTKRKQKR